MDIIKPFIRKIPFYTCEEYKGGMKFRNGDTFMARITPCLSLTNHVKRHFRKIYKKMLDRERLFRYSFLWKVKFTH